MKGKFYVTAKGYKSYEIFEADETFIFKIADILVDKLEFKKEAVPIIGLDGCYMDFFKNHIVITVGWDNWSGCFAMSNCCEGERYIIELGKYVDSFLETL